jgi:hypothetical protein
MKKNEMGGACGTYGGEERRPQRLGREAKGMRPLGIPRRRWEDYNKMELVTVGFVSTLRNILLVIF